MALSAHSPSTSLLECGEDAIDGALSALAIRLEPSATEQATRVSTLARPW
jgi:hypothetical protein